MERHGFAQVNNITYLQGLEQEPLTHINAVTINALHPQQTFKVEVNNVKFSGVTKPNHKTIIPVCFTLLQ